MLVYSGHRFFAPKTNYQVEQSIIGFGYKHMEANTRQLNTKIAKNTEETIFGEGSEIFSEI